MLIQTSVMFLHELYILGSKKGSVDVVEMTFVTSLTWSKNSLTLFDRMYLNPAVDVKVVGWNLVPSVFVALTFNLQKFIISSCCWYRTTIRSNMHAHTHVRLVQPCVLLLHAADTQVFVWTFFVALYLFRGTLVPLSETISELERLPSRTLALIGYAIRGLQSHT